MIALDESVKLTDDCLLNQETDKIKHEYHIMAFTDVVL